MDAETQRTLITAGSALAGVALGSVLSGIGASITGWKKRKQEAEYLALTVVPLLERFAHRCRLVSMDDGTDDYGQPSGQDERCEIVVPDPEFKPDAIVVDWKSVPAEISFFVLQLPYRLEMMRSDYSGEYSYDDTPDYTPFFNARRLSFATLGIEVLNVSAKLRKIIGENMDTYWMNNYRVMSDVVIELGAEKMRRDAQRQELQELYRADMAKRAAEAAATAKA